MLNVLWEQARPGRERRCPAPGPPSRARSSRPGSTPTSSNLTPTNQPDLAVADEPCRTPIMHVWDHGDHNACGATPMLCPTRSGSPVTMGSADCVHEPCGRRSRRAGPRQPLGEHGAVVDDPARPEACDRHVPTSSGTLVNTDPAFPADYNAAILAWVDAPPPRRLTTSIDDR